MKPAVAEDWSDGVAEGGGGGVEEAECGGEDEVDVGIVDFEGRGEADELELGESFVVEAILEVAMVDEGFGIDEESSAEYSAESVA